MVERDIEVFGLNEQEYNECFSLIYDKYCGRNNLTWQDIVDKYDLPVTATTLRKSSGTVFGGAFVYQYFFDKKRNEEADKIARRDNNAELNRIARQHYRKENFYEKVSRNIVTLPVPDVYEVPWTNEDDNEYVLTIGDIHAGAKFTSMNNTYNLTEVNDRLSNLLGQLKSFILNNEISKLKIIIMGDEIQGMLRITDVKLNETAVVEAVVYVSRLLADFLNKLSAYSYLDVYYVPTSNHNQTRPLGTKASELAAEDMSFIIGNYIKDVLAANDRVNINLNFGQEYIKIPIFDFNVIAMHGHQIKNIKQSVRDLSFFHKEIFDYVFLAHFHSSQEMVVGESESHENEVIIVPSMVGSDPYSDKLMLGAKASCKIHVFDKKYGRISSHKFILN